MKKGALMQESGYRTRIKLALLTLMAFVVAGCGGNDCESIYGDGCLDTAEIQSFRVYGNDSPVNGRQQIVAGINSGKFQMGLFVDPLFADDAKIWVSDRKDLGTTSLEQEIAHFKCGYYPFCSFNLPVSCSFSVANRVNCGVTSGLDELIQTTFLEADITPLLNGNQTDLFIVVRLNANGVAPAQRNVPVTFRYN